MRVVRNNSNQTKASNYKSYRSGASGTASSKTSTSKTSTSGSAKIAETTKNCTAIKNASDSLQSHVSKLLATGTTSLFAMAASEETVSSQSSADNSATQATGSSTATDSSSSVNKDNLLKEIKSFVEDYNTMTSAMSATGGTMNNLFLNQIKSYATQNKSALKDIGIVQKTNGTLSINQKTFKAADTDALKKVFNRKECFASKVSAKSEKAETNAANTLSSLKKSTSSNYDKNGYLSNLTNSGSIINSKG